jgi:hypothetical protein
MPSQGTSTFDLFALRFHCTAPEPVHFPRGATANLFRGQLGKILHRRDAAMYAQLFAPVRGSDSPSGFHDPPRPFVLRVLHLEGATLQNFHIGINVFQTADAVLESLQKAVSELAQESLRANLIAVEGQQILRLPLGARVSPRRVRVNFLSPTELKNQARPDFGPLFARIRDRISTLRALYGSGPLEIDFKSMCERAKAIRMTRCDLVNVEAARFSRSSSQHHPLSGFTGIVEYEGDLAEFLPYLEIAGYTGVGRQTVWGKGEISIETL